MRTVRKLCFPLHTATSSAVCTAFQSGALYHVSIQAESEVLQHFSETNWLTQSIWGRFQGAIRLDLQYTN